MAPPSGRGEMARLAGWIVLAGFGDVGERMLEGVECLVWRDADLVDVVGAVVDEVDRDLVVVWSPEQRDLDAVAGAVREFFDESAGSGLQSHALLLCGCVVEESVL